MDAPSGRHCGDPRLAGGLPREIGMVVTDEEAAEAVEMTAFEDFVAERVRAGDTIIGLYPATKKETTAKFAGWRKADGR